MRPWSPNYVVFCGPETVILKILTLAKGFLQTDQCFYLIKINAKMMEKIHFLWRKLSQKDWISTKFQLKAF